MLLYFALAGIILSEYVQLISDRGSFLDSLWGRSKCDGCGKEIPWFALIPFLGRFISKGTCPHCKKKVSWRYFVFEVLFSFGWLVLLYLLSWQGTTEVTQLVASLLLYCVTILLVYEDYKHYSVPVSWLVSWIIIFVVTWYVFGGGMLFVLDTLITLGVLLLSLGFVLLRRPKAKRSVEDLFGAADFFVLIVFALFLGFQKTTWILILSLVGAFLFLLFEKRLREGQRVPLLTVMLPWGIIALLFL